MSSGLLVIGNPGVGKSRVCNVTLDRRDAFVHKTSIFAVTHAAEMLQFAHANRVWSVWNLPGMVEPQCANAERNRQALLHAYRAKPECVFWFVVGSNNGRVRDQDVVLFQLCRNTFRFLPSQIALLINDPTASVQFASFLHTFQAATDFSFVHTLLVPNLIGHEGVVHHMLRQLLGEMTLHRGGEVDAKQLVSESEVMRHTRAEIQRIEREQKEQAQKHAIEMARCDEQIAKLQHEIKQQNEQHHKWVSEQHQANDALVRSMEQLRVQGERDQQQHELVVASVHNDMKQSAADRDASVLVLEQDLAQTNARMEAQAAAHTRLCAQYDQAYAELVRAVHEMNEQIDHARREYSKSKRFGRQLENVAKHIAKKPLQTILPLALTAAIPFAAPAVAAALSTTTTVVSVGMGAAVGGGSAALNKQNVIQGMLTGGITGGAGAFAKAAELSALPAIAVQSSAAATTAAIQRQNPVAAAIGAAAGGMLAAAPIPVPANAVAEIAQQSAVQGVSGAISAMVDRKDVGEALAQGLVMGAVSGTTTRTVAKMVAPKPVVAAAKRDEKTNPPSTHRHKVSRKPEQKDEKQAKPIPEHKNEKQQEKRKDETPSSTHEIHSSSSSANIHISVDHHGHLLGIDANGNWIGMDGTVGVTREGPNGSHVRDSVGASGVYPGGIMYRQTIIGGDPTAAVPHEEHGGAHVGVHAHGKWEQQARHEVIGACHSHITEQHVHVNATTGTATPITVVEHHANMEGCFGDPARAAVVSAAAVIIAPEVPVANIVSKIIPGAAAVVLAQ